MLVSTSEAHKNERINRRLEWIALYSPRETACYKWIDEQDCNVKQNWRQAIVNEVWQGCAFEPKRNLVAGFKSAGIQMLLLDSVNQVTCDWSGTFLVCIDGVGPCPTQFRAGIASEYRIHQATLTHWLCYSGRWVGWHVCRFAFLSNRHHQNTIAIVAGIS